MLIPLDPTTCLRVSTPSLESAAYSQPRGGRSQLPAVASGRGQQGTHLGGRQVTAEEVSRGDPSGRLNCSRRAAPSVAAARQGSGFHSLSWAPGWLTSQQECEHRGADSAARGVDAAAGGPESHVQRPHPLSCRVPPRKPGYHRQALGQLGPRAREFFKACSAPGVA